MFQFDDETGKILIINNNISNNENEGNELIIKSPYHSPTNSRIKSRRNNQHLKEKSINDTNIDLDILKFQLPTIESLKLTQQERLKLINNTSLILSNYTESIQSKIYLATLSELELKNQIQIINKNIKEGEKLLTIWCDQIKEGEKDKLAYEGVIESLVGYTQRLRREEIIREQSKNKNKRNSWWNKKK